MLMGSCCYIQGSWAPNSIIAERLSARQLIVQCGLKSQLVYIYMCATSVTLYVPYTCYYYVCTFRTRVVTTAVAKRFRPRGPPGEQARVQDGVLTSYMDVAFVLLTPEGAEIWTNRSLLFTQVGLLQLQRDYSLCSLCFSRDLTAGDRRCADRSPAIRT